MPEKHTASAKGGLVPLALMASLLPIWSSGMRKHLTLWGFIINHTVFGPPVEYVPEELYQDALCTIGTLAEANGRLQAEINSGVE